MSHDTGFLAHEASPERPPRRHIWPVLAAVIGVLLLVWVVIGTVAAAQVGVAVLDGKTHLEQARTDASNLDFVATRTDLNAADESFSAAENHLGILKSFSFLPWIGAQIDAGAAGLVSGREVLAGITRLTTLGEDLVRLSGLTQQDLANLTSGVAGQTTFQNLPAETKRAMLARLATAGPELERAAANIAIARADLASVSRDQLAGPIANALRPIDEKLASLQDGLHVAAVGARLLPAFAGLEGLRTTLVLFLNNAELRPGGGFVGSFGLLSMKDGDIASMNTYDVYNLDRPAEAAINLAPPAPFTRYLGLTKWLFRDANWSPDFAVSARTLLDRRRAEVTAVAPEQRAGALADVPVQNVAGMTPTFVGSLLKIVGPISLDGQTFTPENIFDKIQYQVEFGYAKQGVPEEQRKELLGRLVDEVKRRLYALPLARWPEVITALQTGLDTKQVALYSDDQSTEDSLTKFGWGGRVQTPAAGTDALMAVDANLGALKSDPVVDRTISYALRLNNSRQLVAKTTIRYTHRGTFDWKTSRYRSYVRLYVPSGSQLVKTTGSLADDKTKNASLASGTTDVATDLGFTTFGTFIAVEPGETRELTFEYLLPDAVSKAAAAGTYRLQLFKQIGAAPRALTLRLSFDKNVATADPPEARTNWGDKNYTLDTTLDQDKMFTVGF